MTDTWGPLTVPVADQPDNQVQGDPALGFIGDYLKAFLVTDENATDSWTKAGVAPGMPPVQKVVIGRPDDLGYQFNANDLPALFLWREGGEAEIWADDWDCFRDRVKILWVIPTGQRDHQRRRIPYAKALVNCVYSAIELERTPGWVQPGDPDPHAATKGSLLYNYALFVHFRLKAWKIATLSIRGGDKKDPISQYPALEMSFELVENRVQGLDAFPILNGATDTISTVTTAPYTTWTASSFYELGAFVVPSGSGFGGYYFVCTTPGRTGSTSPSWTTVVNATVTDGTVVWTCVGLVSEVVESGPLETSAPTPGQSHGTTPAAPAPFTPTGPMIGNGGSVVTGSYTMLPTDELTEYAAGAILTGPLAPVIASRYGVTNVQGICETNPASLTGNGATPYQWQDPNNGAQFLTTVSLKTTGATNTWIWDGARMVFA